MGIAFLKEEIVNKTRRYSHYYWNLINRGTVHANIHSIEAEDKKEREARIRAAEKGSSRKGNPAFPGWEKHTLNKCIVYQGAGTHLEMFAPPFLEKNAAVINNILKNIKIVISKIS
jgi:thioesterase domain-containing protein